MLSPHQISIQTNNMIATERIEPTLLKFVVHTNISTTQSTSIEYHSLIIDCPLKILSLSLLLIR